MSYQAYRSVSIIAKPNSQTDDPLPDGWYLVRFPDDWSPPSYRDDLTGYLSVCDWWADCMIGHDTNTVVAEVQFLPGDTVWVKVNGWFALSGTQRNDWLTDIVEHEDRLYDEIDEPTRLMMGLPIEESVEPVIEHLLVA